MNVGMLGMGKLGLPVALAIEKKGHKVSGFDINPNVAQYLSERKIPFKEKDIQPLLDSTRITLKTVNDLVTESDIIFCAIQTPHDKEYEGTSRIPETRKDFDYTYLKEAVKTIAAKAAGLKKEVTLVVISTCLPGTFNREIKPLLNEYVNYVYNPFFIAMGQVIDDFLNPEFVLIGTEDKESKATKQLRQFYETIHNKEHVVTDTTTAEGIKVSYNTWITAKTVIANVWGELSMKLGMNFDDIYKAWSLAGDRLISTRYMKSGVGDGGGCHPRDNIALSYIANEVRLSHNIFDDLMKAREDHMDWLARTAINLAKEHDLPLVVLGRSFKPETNIETGSPAVLMANIIHDDYGYPVQHVEDLESDKPCAIAIATMHERYKSVAFPKGSVVLDPFRYIDDAEGVVVYRVG